MMSVQRKEKKQNPAPWQIFRQMVTSSLGPFLLLSVLREKLRLVSSLQLLLRGCRQTASFPPMYVVAWKQKKKNSHPEKGEHRLYHQAHEYVLCPSTSSPCSYSVFEYRLCFFSFFLFFFRWDLPDPTSWIRIMQLSDWVGHPSSAPRAFSGSVRHENIFRHN